MGKLESEKCQLGGQKDTKTEHTDATRCGH